MAEIEYQTKDEPFDKIGVKILPTNLKGKSPFMAEFDIIASDLAQAYSVDFADGTHEAGVLIDEGETRRASISHEYKYRQGWSKYYAHAYYPIVTVYGTSPNGQNIQTTINTETGGRALTIIVVDPKHVIPSD